MQFQWGMLSKKQKEIYDLYVNQGFTMREIAARRGIRHEAVWKQLQSIKKKGFDFGKNRQVNKRGMPSIIQVNKTNKKYYRLHNIHLVATPYYFYPRYKQNIGHIFYLGKYTVTCNMHNIEIQTKRLESFDSEDLDACYFDFREDLEATLPKIENRLGCEIMHQDKLNIRLCNSHIAEVNNGIARRLQGHRVTIEGDTGKVRVLIDMSTGLPELEAVEPVLSQDDMQLIKKHMRCWLNPKVMTLIEVQDHLAIQGQLLIKIGKSLGFDNL